MKDQNTGAANDITIAVEFLMVATRALLKGKAQGDKEVNEPLGWAIRKLIPLDKTFPIEAQRVKGSKKQ
jgi:hypothetical protein